MPKYRKRAIVIEAEQFLGEKVTGMCDAPKCFINLTSNSPHVHTIHNNQPVNVVYGDFIIPEPVRYKFLSVQIGYFHRNSPTE